MTSTLPHSPLHVAIIMDGNGRWAAARHLARTEGHRAGARALERIVEAASRLGVGVLTVYAFSADNWKRPAAEVYGLFRLMGDYLRRQRRRCAEDGVRISVVGRRDRIPGWLLRNIEAAEQQTRCCARIHLRIALDYSARQSLLRAAGDRRCGSPLSAEEFGEILAQAEGGGERTPDVDVLIRTGGEKRLSDFLLWESSYAELVFVDTAWPDFNAEHLAACLAEFRGRQRRYGGLPSGEAGQHVA